ncbi:hypothetical protein C2S53_003094 [Perilla frutescens var. hirtella]|uniref:B3 domain-containing protein n=1 Tax=Perilla frutescens var. hirtella TaxID=608512 RepID=A0AAD4JNY9_PERFH|nr:hypothetical protein C2S53_003094 [Perilla frutescens var. hirtella]
MAMFRDLTFDDVKDMLNMKGNAFDVLAAVAGRGKEIFDDHIAETETKRLKRIHHDDDGEASTSISPKKRKCNSPNIKINGQHPPPPPLPEEFQNVIQEMAQGKNLTPPTLVIQKSLFGTDLSPGHNRLSIPMSQILSDDFLTDEEKRLVRSCDVATKKKKYIDVTIIEPSLKSETVKFSRWDMPKGNGGKTSSSYVINGRWNAIVEKNKLRVKMEVQLWCFRVDGDLRFALVRLPRNSSGFSS